MDAIDDLFRAVRARAGVRRGVTQKKCPRENPAGALVSTAQAPMHVDDPGSKRRRVSDVRSLCLAASESTAEACQPPQESRNPMDVVIRILDSLSATNGRCAGDIDGDLDLCGRLIDATPSAVSENEYVGEITRSSRRTFIEQLRASATAPSNNYVSAPADDRTPKRSVKPAGSHRADGRRRDNKLGDAAMRIMYGFDIFPDAGSCASPALTSTGGLGGVFLMPEREGAAMNTPDSVLYSL